MGDKRPYLFPICYLSGSLYLSGTLGSRAQILSLYISLQSGRGGWVRSPEGSREDLRAWVGQAQERENHSHWRIREETKLHRSSRGWTKGGSLNAKKGIYRDQCVLRPRESDDVHVYGFLMPRPPPAPCSPAAEVCNPAAGGLRPGPGQSLLSREQPGM